MLSCFRDGICSSDGVLLAGAELEHHAYHMRRRKVITNSEEQMELNTHDTGCRSESAKVKFPSKHVLNFVERILGGMQGYVVLSKSLRQPYGAFEVGIFCSCSSKMVRCLSGLFSFSSTSIGRLISSCNSRCMFPCSAFFSEYDINIARFEACSPTLSFKFRSSAVYNVQLRALNIA